VLTLGWRSLPFDSQSLSRALRRSLDRLGVAYSAAGAEAPQSFCVRQSGRKRAHGTPLPASQAATPLSPDELCVTIELLRDEARPHETGPDHRPATHTDREEPVGVARRAGPPSPLPCGEQAAPLHPSSLRGKAPRDDAVGGNTVGRMVGGTERYLDFYASLRQELSLQLSPARSGSAAGGVAAGSGGCGAPLLLSQYSPMPTSVRFTGHAAPLACWGYASAPGEASTGPPSADFRVTSSGGGSSGVSDFASRGDGVVETASGKKFQRRKLGESFTRW